MYTQIKGKMHNHEEEVVLDSNSSAMCFGQWTGLAIKGKIPDKVSEVTGAKFGFYVRHSEVQEGISHMEKIINLFQRVDWFPQELEVSKTDSYGDNFIVVDFHKHVDMPADKLIWCFKNIRAMFGKREDVELEEFFKLPPSALLLFVLTLPSISYGRTNIFYHYDWEDSNIYWSKTTQEMYKKLMALEEPHWKQEPFFDKEEGRINGYLKSHMMVEGYEYGDEVEESEYVTDSGLPFLDIPLQFGLDPSNTIVSEIFLESEVNELLGEVL